MFSTGFAPNENPEEAGAGAAAGVSLFSAGLAPNENPEAAGAGAAGAVVLVDAASAGLPKEKPEAGGLEAGVVDPALLPPSPENNPPAALPALAAGAAPSVPAAGLFMPPKEKEGIALLEDGAAVDDAVLLLALVCPKPPKEGIEGAGVPAGVVDPAVLLLPPPNRLKAGFGAGVCVAGLGVAAPEA